MRTGSSRDEVHELIRLVDSHIDDASMGEETTADEPIREKREILVSLTLHEASKAKVTITRSGEPFASRSISGEEVTDGVCAVYVCF